MRAIRVTQFGGPDVLSIADVEPPPLSSDAVRVRVRAAGVNPVDTYIRAGTYARKPALPYTPGTDAAGVIDAVGDAVHGWRVGDHVYVAAAAGASHSGAYAELMTCSARCVHPLPASLSAEQGAAIGVPYATAWRGLCQKAHVRPGETVLVHGASGGVGVAAVQIARALGAHVIGTAGTDTGLELVRSEGAHLALDHTTSDYRDQVMRATDGRGVNVIVEMLANVNLQYDTEMAAPFGRIVVIGSRGTLDFAPRLLMGKDLTVVGMAYWNTPADDDREVHAALGAGFESGTLRPIVGRQFGLDDAPSAHEAVMAPGAHGKIVLIP